MRVRSVRCSKERLLELLDYFKGNYYSAMKEPSKGELVFLASQALAAETRRKPTKPKTPASPGKGKTS